MPKSIEDIVVPERRRSIRDVPIPESRRGHYSPLPPQPPHLEHPHPPRSKRGRKGLWLASSVALLVLVFAILSIFNGATLAYVPKSANLSFENQNYNAKKTGESGLLFSVIKLSSDKGEEVAASGQESVERKASGTIVVYNTTAKVQKFRSTTRFKTPDGKTYQVKDEISVPAKGSIEAVVYSEFPGQEFNIGLSDFTLPGLSKTSLASSVYARSKSPMTGGFKGMEKIVSSGDKTKVRSDLELVLRDELISEAKAQVPQDFILIPSLSIVTFEDLPQTESSDSDKATINLRGNLQSVMFKRGDLSTYLTLGKVALTPEEQVDLKELDALSFSFSGKAPSDLVSQDEIKFGVTGEAMAIWRTDEVSLKTDLVGKNKKDIYSILKNYPTVVSATATIRPFWKSSFPSDSTDITIKQLPSK